MKIQVAILLALLSIGMACELQHNGQPGCKTELEMRIKFFRNNWNPSQYWVCEQLGKPGKIATCPLGTGYKMSTQECVIWELWRWEAPQPVISRPDAV